jgi:RsiW-degrading membrane proteinase PrsW (M82 family)
VYSRDKNPEPRELLINTFLLGALICLPVVPVAMMLESLGQGMTGDVWSTAFVKAFLGAAIPEELFKFLVLRLYVWRKSHFDEPLDGVVYGATASLGFATLENILYVEMYGLGTAVLRAVTAIPGHAFTGVLMGAFVGRARFAAPEQRSRLLAAGLGWAILLHGAYDLFLFTESAFALLALAVLFIEVRWGRKLYKQLQAEQVVMPGEVLVAPAMAGQGVVARMETPAGGAESVVAVSVTEAAVLSRATHEPVRTLGSWLKLVVGGLGLSACGLWWLGVAAVIFFPDASAEPLTLVGEVGLVIISAIPTLLFLGTFRSGLSGPFAPARA